MDWVNLLLIFGIDRQESGAECCDANLFVHCDTRDMHDWNGVCCSNLILHIVLGFCQFISKASVIVDLGQDSGAAKHI